MQVEPSTLERLGKRCSEFLVHGVDVEGRQLGVDEELVNLLSQCVAIPTTYAGGVTTMVRSKRSEHVDSELSVAIFFVADYKQNNNPYRPCLELKTHQGFNTTRRLYNKNDIRGFRS
jgi:phosphoribosylformimino-5-aminoimidazole carboxamide ribotide isomerase